MEWLYDEFTVGGSMVSFIKLMMDNSVIGSILTPGRRLTLFDKARFKDREYRFYLIGCARSRGVSRLALRADWISEGKKFEDELRIDYALIDGQFVIWSGSSKGCDGKWLERLFVEHLGNPLKECQQRVREQLSVPG
jgi:hypothetical protein